MKILSAFSIALVSLLALSGCAAESAARVAGTGTLVLPGVPLLAGARTPSSPIKHVVFIIQENRSFDNLFQGYPGANTAASGLNSQGQTIALTPIPFEAPYDVSHGSGDFLNATDGGKMDGFNKELIEGNAQQYPNPQYGYVPKSETKIYFAMAKQYVLADNAFTSHLDASYVAHQYAIAAQANAAVDLPPYFGCDKDPSNVIATLTQQRTIGPTEPTCQDYQTLGDELDSAKLSWRYYTFTNSDWIWVAYSSVHHIRYGPDWKKDIVQPETRFIDDVNAGSLPTVAWVTPSVSYSDHSSSLSKKGPDWVAAVVNAVGESKYWNSTAIFIMWDEWGGWYDHVPPPYEDYDGLGIRVPLMVISPYAKQNYVSHVQYEMSSVLRFIEDRWQLSQLAASDARATDPSGDCFDFSQKARTFVPFKTSIHIKDITATDARVTAMPDDQ